MSAVTLCLLLLALTCAASLLGRAVRVPLPFVQIAVGVAAALPPFRLHAEFDPHTFLFLFLPPLLFGDAWGVSRRELRAMRWPVLGLAIGLVLATVAIGGPALHWLIPGLPLSVAFAIAALVSPTDPVAVSAITERIAVPRRMMQVLEGEALLNDATGLVAMRFAVAATLSGAFSLPNAAGAFVLVAGGGAAIGWLLTLGYARLHRRLPAGAEDAALQTVMLVLLPFAAYTLAEEAGASGILAVVAAGLAASRFGLLERAHYSARLQMRMTGDLIRFTLNGIIFVLLGLQLPGIVGSGPEGIDLVASSERGTVLGEIAALLGLLVAIRLVWVLAALLLRRAMGLEKWVGWRVVAAASLAGVRGAVTLAGVLSVPLLLPSGAPFPGRDLAVTLATGVILGSMLIAAAGLPLLLRHVAPDEDGRDEASAARARAMEAALRTVSADAGPREAGLVAVYRERLAALAGGGSEDEERSWRELSLTALRAERRAVQELRASDTIDDAVARELLGELDLIEAATMRRPFRAPVAGG